MEYVRSIVESQQIEDLFVPESHVVLERITGGGHHGVADGAAPVGLQPVVLHDLPPEVR